MNWPVKDPMNDGNFVPASKTAAFFANKNLTFSDLKKELLNTDKNPFQAAKDKEDKEGDANTVGSEFFKGQKVWDVVECNTCNFHCCIYSANLLNSSKLHLLRAQRKKALYKLEAYKYSYVYVNVYPVDHFETNLILSCGDFVYMQYFTFTKGKNDWNVDIYCYCFWPDNLLTIEKMKEEFDYGMIWVGQ